MLSKIEKLGKVAMTVDKNFWSAEKCYDKLVLVQQEGGGTYISRKPVPRGIELTDRNYWIPIMPGETNYTNTNNSGNIVGRTAKCATIPFNLLCVLLESAEGFGNYEDYSQSELNSTNKQLGFEIDCIKKSIDLDEITPKIVTEADDNQLCFFEFISAYMSVYGSSGGGITKSDTKYAPTDEYSYMWKRNAVILKQDNDVLRCIEEHEELFYAYLYMIEEYGDSQRNQDLYYEQLGVEPFITNPYHDFSGTYVNRYAAQNGTPSGYRGKIGRGENISDRNINLTKSKVISKEETKSEDKQESKGFKIISREELNTFIENLKARSLERSTATRKLNTKSANTKSTTRVSSGDDYDDYGNYDDIPDFPFETETEVNILTDFKALACEGDQTINIKKYMISFYKMMKLFEAHPNGINTAVNDIISIGELIPQDILLGVLFAGGTDALFEYFQSYKDLDFYYGIDGDVIIRTLFHDKYNSILKEIQDAVNHFDVLLGNGQNMPYEDTISMFIKFKDTWYEVIAPQQENYFEPNREYKLVHTGDWKHVGTYNNQVLTTLIGEIGHDNIMSPIERTSNIYEEIYDSNDDNYNDNDNPTIYN